MRQLVGTWKSEIEKSERLDSVRLCAGFSDACITEPSTRSGGRRRRSAKARNRGQEGAWFRRCELWGFEAWACLCSRGWNGERLAIWRVDRWREPCGAGVGMRFGAAAAMTRGRRSMIARVLSALSNSQRQVWTVLCCGRQCNRDHDVSILITRGAVADRCFGWQPRATFLL